MRQVVYKHWFWKQWHLGGKWTACVQLGPWWTIAFNLCLALPSFDCTLLFLSFNIGRWDALDTWTMDEVTGEWVDTEAQQ